MKSELLSNFPKKLDEAVVLYAALAKKEDYTYYAETDVSVLIVYYALACYEGDSRVYCFSLNSNFEVIGDMLWDSVEEAMEMSMKYDDIEPADWEKVG